MASPWKRKKENTKEPTIDELNKLIFSSYGSKVKDRKKLAIVKFVAKGNKKKKENHNGWLFFLVQSHNIEYQSLLSFFFYDDEEFVDSFNLAFGTNNRIRTESLQLVENALSNVTIQVDDEAGFKSNLLSAIKRSYAYNKNGDGDTHPVIILLSETNRISEAGWLFGQDYVKGKEKAKRSKLANYLITMLYTITGCGINNQYCAELASAIGSKANAIHKRKELLRDIARECMENVIKNVRVTSNNTITTAMTTHVSTEPTATSTDPLPASTSVHSKPPSVITNVNDSNNRILSPLTETNANLSFGGRFNWLSRMANAFSPAKLKNAELGKKSTIPSTNSSISPSTSTNGVRTNKTMMQLPSDESLKAKVGSNDDEINSFPTAKLTPRVESNRIKLSSDDDGGGTNINYNIDHNDDIITTKRNNTNTETPQSSPYCSYSFQMDDLEEQKLEEGDNGQEDTDFEPSCLFGHPSPETNIRKTHPTPVHDALTSPTPKRIFRVRNDRHQRSSIVSIREALSSPASTRKATPSSGIYTSTSPRPKRNYRGRKDRHNKSPNEELVHITKEIRERGDVQSAANVMIGFLADVSSSLETNWIEDAFGKIKNTNMKNKLWTNVGEFLLKQQSADGVIKFREKKFIRIKASRAVKGAIKKQSTRTKWFREKRNEIKKIVKVIVGPENQQYTNEILSSLGNEKAESSKITALEMIAVRDKAGLRISNLVVTKFASLFEVLLKNKKLLKNNDARIFEGQLRKRLGKVEREGTVPVEVVQVKCETSKGEFSWVSFYFIPNVPLVLERQTANSIVDGSFLPSIDVSSFDDKILFKAGCDRGAGCVINMVSLINRKDGNTGKRSTPIAVVPRALETYDNLAKTVYSEERKQIIEQLLNQHLYMIQFRFINNKEGDITVMDAKCIVIRLEGIDRDILSNTKFDVDIKEVEQIPFDDTQMESKAKNRDNAEKVSVTEEMCNNNNGCTRLQLQAHLVRSFDNKYFGCKISSLKTGEEMLSFEFDYPVDINGIDCTTGSCSQIIGFPSEDGKMVTSLQGLSTNGASFPCPKCIWHLKDKTLPPWVKTMLENLQLDLGGMKFEEYDLRVKEKSKILCYNEFAVRRCNRTNPITREMKQDAFSVVHKPLVSIDDEFLYLHNGEPLHISQGFMTHLTQMICIILDTITLDGEETFTNRLNNEIQKYLDKIKEVEESREYKKAKKDFKSMTGEVETAYANYQKAKDEGKDEEQINDLYRDFIDLATDRNEDQMEVGEFVRFERIINGAEEISKLLEKFKTSKRKNISKPVYLFMKALKSFAGDNNSWHGVHELTNQRGIKGLKSRQDIYNLVVAGCQNNAEVKKAMDWWLKCAKYLLDISLIMKSQEKLEDATIQKLKVSAVKYVQLWYPMVLKYSDTKNPVFWKLHMFFCGIIPFAEITKMIGLDSAEGFENNHFVIEKINQLMKSIPEEKLRCEKISQRQQAFSIPGIGDVHKIFDEVSEDNKRGPRGPYKNRGKRTKVLEELPQHQQQAQATIDGYFVSQNGNFISNEIEEQYVFITYGKVPNDWVKAFHEEMNVGCKVAREAEFT